MDCNLCTEKYNSNNRKSLCLNCGHSFCLNCLNKLKFNLNYVCPKCKRPKTNEQPNYSLIEWVVIGWLLDVIDDYYSELEQIRNVQGSDFCFQATV